MTVPFIALSMRCGCFVGPEVAAAARIDLTRRCFLCFDGATAFGGAITTPPLPNARARTALTRLLLAVTPAAVIFLLAIILQALNLFATFAAFLFASENLPRAMMSERKKGDVAQPHPNETAHVASSRKLGNALSATTILSAAAIK